MTAYFIEITNNSTGHKDFRRVGYLSEQDAWDSIPFLRMDSYLTYNVVEIDVR